jgi:hypothetical protein
VTWLIHQHLMMGMWVAQIVLVMCYYGALEAQVDACSSVWYVIACEAAKLHSHSRTASRSEVSYLVRRQEGHSCDLTQCERAGRQCISVSDYTLCVCIHLVLVRVDDHIHSTAYRARFCFLWIPGQPISNLGRTPPIPIVFCHSVRHSFLASSTTFTILRHDRFLSNQICIHCSSIQSLEATAY